MIRIYITVLTNISAAEFWTHSHKFSSVPNSVASLSFIKGLKWPKDYLPFPASQLMKIIPSTFKIVVA